MRRMSSWLFLLAFPCCTNDLGGLSMNLVHAESPVASRSTNSNSEVHDQLASLVEKHKAIGLAVAVVKGDKVVYADSFGKQDRERDLPLLNGQLFRIASISKSFSATSIMQLVEAGKVSLDDDVSDLIGFKVRNPNFPDTVITLKLLLSHTSSINDSQGYFRLDPINPDTNADSAKCYSSYAPGAEYRYCNLNFNMVGAIIERVSGERFDKYIAEHILKPLGLDAGFYLHELDSARFVTLYELNGTTKELAPQPAAYQLRANALDDYQLGYSTPIFSPTGGLKISAEDLARYMAMHLNQGEIDGVKIISPESAAIMQSNHTPNSNYGLGLMKRDQLIPGKLLTGHTGSAYGLFSTMFFDPENKIGFVAVTNGSPAGYSEGSETLLKEAVRTLHSHFE